MNAGTLAVIEGLRRGECVDIVGSSGRVATLIPVLWLGSLVGANLRGAGRDNGGFSLSDLENSELTPAVIETEVNHD